MTPNPAWDVTYPVPQLHVGGSTRVHSPTAQAGGKGVNVARVVRQLGGQALVIAPVGGCRGQAFTESLAADNVPARLVPVDFELRQSIAIVPKNSDPVASSPTVLNEAGEPLHSDAWNALIGALEDAVDKTQPEVVVVSGSLPPGATADQLGALIRVGRAQGAAVLVDTSGEPLVWAAQAGADLVKPNRSEALEATGAAAFVTAADELRKLGARSVVVTDGSAGMWTFDGGRVWHARPRSLTSGNPTGAGDAALAALAMTWEESWAHRLESAAAASVAAVHDPSAGRVDPHLVAKIRETVHVEESSCP